ncbi:hypothetical protein NDU88_008830 [Pleurodeles waltl]|uniref:Uncharacterized protein n=1 Tax=Pleurodeles waltl TaxID=8319 RepID=A0AAV7NE81_PLEWA|nr:hypothetical protein NDU88_008830 [Pleurodeles waltl]
MKKDYIVFSAEGRTEIRQCGRVKEAAEEKVREPEEEESVEFGPDLEFCGDGYTLESGGGAPPDGETTNGTSSAVLFLWSRFFDYIIKENTTNLKSNLTEELAAKTRPLLNSTIGNGPEEGDP